jgi:O-antigen/teichoic acid export membrane protein
MLLIFGHEYASAGAPLLSVVAIASLPSLLVSLYVSVARVRGRVVALILVQGLPMLAFLALAGIWLKPFGITGVGGAYLAVQSAAATIVVALSLRGTLVRGRALHRAEGVSAGQQPSVPI